MIAEVVVDIKNKAVDKIFDYQVPKELEAVMLPGVRVLVPFGPRTVMGFVTRLKEASPQQNLRKIKEQLDLLPVLNDELRALAVTLSEETGATMIRCFEAMIPTAMRATYKKKIRRLSENLTPTLGALFEHLKVIDYEVIPAKSLNDLKQALLLNQVEIVYEVKDKLGKKTEKYIKLRQPQVQLEAFQRAPMQKQVLETLQNSSVPVLKRELAAGAPVLKALKEKGLIEEIEVEVYRDPFAKQTLEKSIALILNEEQEAAVNAVKEGKDSVFLLHGITGSGKTEVYLQVIENVIKAGKQAIVLVPEISLTPQIATRFRSRFQNQVAVLHSGLSVGEKYDEWRKILKQEVSIVVGARSAVFAPFGNIGIIIVDEEHEATYKQEETPRYHAIEVAKHRATTHGCPVILGSATPSLETFARAKKGVYQLLTLSKRAVSEANLPQIKLIDMRKEYGALNQALVSDQMQAAIAERLARDEQVVLLLNRRGYANFMQCRDCGDVVSCTNCDVSLTYHKSHQHLKCHYCGFVRPILKSCPSCQSAEVRLFGTGTQKIEEYLQKQFPSTKILRMDVDTTSKKGAHQQLIAAFERKEAHILIGTQMVGKGLDFPSVTLVGVVAADLMLHLPDYKAVERTFQLLTQVAGRAGRHELAGEVLIQTYSPDHYVMEQVLKQDYNAFYELEMKNRHQFSYPPYFYLASVMLSSEDYQELILWCDKVNSYLRKHLAHSCLIVGPTMPHVSRVNGRFRMYFIIKYKREPNLRNILSSLMLHLGDSRVSLMLDYFPNQIG